MDPKILNPETKFGENATYQEDASFTVSENLLPKFEVLIENPEFILRNSEEQEFDICAKYTHGGNVKGSLNVTFSVDYTYSYWNYEDYYEDWNYIVEKIKINKIVDELQKGCVKLSLNNKVINTQRRDIGQE